MLYWKDVVHTGLAMEKEDLFAMQHALMFSRLF
jgi:hypothetical protein